ncbi:MAG: hypothetical protein VYD64_02220, partial [Pseudomonadota bacterium]|nr:hypothetical protein [Pseudomonadota bacterium]
MLSATAGHAGTSADAACVQSYLNYYGYNAGEVDGKIGRLTQGAFRRAVEDGFKFDRTTLHVSGSDEVCMTLARKVAQERGNPDVIYVLDVPFNSSTMVNIDIGIRAAREKLDSEAGVTVYAFRNRKLLFSKFREISRATGRQTEQFWSRVVGLANGKHIFLDLGKMKGGSHERFVAAHEYAHVHQHALLGRKQTIRKDG